MIALLITATLISPAAVLAETGENELCQPVADAAKGVYGIKLSGGSWQEVLASFKIKDEHALPAGSEEAMVISVTHQVYNFTELNYTQAQIGEVAMSLCRTYMTAQRRARVD